MSKERYDQIIDEVYRNYKRITHEKNEKNCNYGEYSKWGDNPLIAGIQHLTKSSFIQMCKNVHEFSEKWGLNIEERDLDADAINVLLMFKMKPTKLITLTYNNETIEVYE